MLSLPIEFLFAYKNMVFTIGSKLVEKYETETLVTFPTHPNKIARVSTIGLKPYSRSHHYKAAFGLRGIPGLIIRA